MLEKKGLASERIRSRLLAAGASFKSNDNIASHIKNDELTELQQEVVGRVEDLLKSLVIDIANDENMRRTASRLAKMYIEEVFRGRYQNTPTLSDYPNAKHYKELYILGPFKVRSACSHHLVPVIGDAWVGVLSGERLIGISKLGRIIDWVMSRPHIQEDATMLLAETLEQSMKPKGLAVFLKLKHFCMHWRGIREENSVMQTFAFKGAIERSKALQEQFFRLRSETNSTPKP